MTDKKVATVIGVGPGLGAALARRFAADYAVALVARNAEKLSELGREIAAAGGISLVVPADVSKEHELAGAFERIRSELGDTDILLYNTRIGMELRSIRATARTQDARKAIVAFGAKRAPAFTGCRAARALANSAPD
jgi:NAD(P)-dependent dehydrogenase (short-subunit alcohol dehydrogenase family)